MRVVKILLISFIFVAGFTLLTSVSSKVWAEENETVAKVQTKPGTKYDCKYVEEKTKDGKIIIKLIGRDCDKAVANWEKQHEGQKVCCVCRRDLGYWICHGTCCKRVPEFALPR